MNNPITKFQKAEVVEFPNNVTSKPVVTICVLAYNQSHFIRKCLDSILSQTLNFTFEILIGEDNSKDSTRQICIEYANRYSNNIRLFLHDRDNVIHNNGRPTGRFNFIYTVNKSKGKYIAIIDGDDYWTDPLKLKKQVDFLEKNEGYVGICSNFSVCNESGEIIKERYFKKGKPSEMDNVSVLAGSIPKTLTVMYRNLPDIFTKMYDHNAITLGDRILAILMTQRGTIKYIDEVTGVYRRGSGNFSSKKAEDITIDRINNYKLIKELYRDKRSLDTINVRINSYYKRLIMINLMSFKLLKALKYNRDRKKVTGLKYDNFYSGLLWNIKNSLRTN